MLNFVILWEDRGFFRFFSFVKNAQFCHFVRGPCIFSLLQFCQKCSILSFCERTVDFIASSILSKMLNFVIFWEGPCIFFASSILSKMLNFVILWEDRGFFRFFNFVKNAQFCHFLRSRCVFSGSSILSKILNFVILKSPIYFFRFFNFVKNAQFCHFLRGPCIFFHVFNFVKNAQFCHFVRGPWIFSLLQFCQKCSILSFWEDRELLQFCPVFFFFRFFNSSILSIILNFVIIKRPIYFFRFFNFVKNAQFCHFLRGPCIFFHVLNFVKNAQFCHFVRGPWIFSILQFCQKCSILSFSERPVDFFSLFSILSKMVHFVTFEKWTSNYEISISILCVHYVLWYIKLFCQKCSILSFCERPVVLFRFFNFVKNAQFCHFVRGPWIFFTFFNFVKNPQFCHLWKVDQIMR